MLHLTLLGHPRLYLDGKEVQIVSRKAQALLYYLVLSDRSHSRTSLAGLFWGDVTEASARRSLRVALSKLRGALGDYIAADRTNIRFDHSRPHYLDVSQLREALLGLPGDVEAARDAAKLLRGEFLEDFHVDGSPEYETWLLSERERIERSGRGLLSALVGHDHEAGHLEKALDYARRLLAMDPWREEAQRWVILILAELGRTAAALAQYERCRELLAEGLGVEPTPETQALAAAVRAGDLEPVPSVAHSRPAQSIPHNLPVASTTFIGRVSELEQIESLLTGDACRLLTILGPGGVGKSRLALEMARRCLKTAKMPFVDGLFFIPLAEAGDDLAQAISSSLELTLTGDSSLESQLLLHLADRQLLLILDNFETVLDQAGWLLKLMSAASAIKLLITCQERLPLIEAWNLDLRGLNIPPAGAGEDLSG